MRTGSQNSRPAASTRRSGNPGSSSNSALVPLARRSRAACRTRDASCEATETLTARPASRSITSRKPWVGSRPGSSGSSHCRAPARSAFPPRPPQIRAPAGIEMALGLAPARVQRDPRRAVERAGYQNAAVAGAGAEGAHCGRIGKDGAQDDGVSGPAQDAGQARERSRIGVDQIHRLVEVLGAEESKCLDRRPAEGEGSDPPKPG